MSGAHDAAGLSSRVGAMLRRIPFVRRHAERRWIPDPAERRAHDLIVRRRLGQTDGPPPQPDEAAPGEVLGG